MLFSSYEFLFVFLPVTIVLFHLLVARDFVRPAVTLLVAASLFFYGWWDVRFLALLLASVSINFLIARLIELYVARNEQRRAGAALTIGVLANLVTLAYFKYAFFIAGNLNALLDANLTFHAVLLPLGISFFTFEQISYLTDVRRNGRSEPDLIHYTFFVVFFPRLVAGPILRAAEILPQLDSLRLAHKRTDDLAIGLTIFAFGLFKKTFLADGIAQYAAPVFSSHESGQDIDLLLAWGGALAYTMQLYFDFSGYSDMAIGVARCFGIRFPMNFYSPYKSTSIIEFWRCWHITLSRFLRDYLYIPLGGSRRGPIRRYVNLLVTMLLGGLWHGANWTFVAWGGLHGTYLVINHGWLALHRRSPYLDRLCQCRTAVFISWLLTFLAVVVAWVFFRSPTFASALSILHAMAGGNGITVPSGVAFLFGSFREPLTDMGITFGDTSGTMLVWNYLWVAGLLAITLLMPNTLQLMSKWQPALDAPKHEYEPLASGLRWVPSRKWAFATASIGLLGAISISRGGEFLYWQF
jgi:alginate O-acetyltransferase complex protein AlgI